MSEDRRKELENKDSLTNSEMAELVSLSPGGFSKLPNLATAGVKNLSKAIENLLNVEERSRRAFEEGFYIEVLSLRSQFVELLLRLYLGKKSSNGFFPEDDTSSLGVLIERCTRSDMDAGIISKMASFNKSRISGIHHYILGASSYQDLKPICENSSKLVKDVIAAVSAEIGVAI